MNLASYAVSLIRTVVPVLVGRLLSLPLVHPVVDALGIRDTANVATTVTAALIVAFYALSRALEQKWPKAGWLLGIPSAPVYGATAIAAPAFPFDVSDIDPNPTPALDALFKPAQVPVQIVSSEALNQPPAPSAADLSVPPVPADPPADPPATPPSA